MRWAYSRSAIESGFYGNMKAPTRRHAVRAATSSETLCGILAADSRVFGGAVFAPDHKNACPSCRTAIAKASHATGGRAG